MITYAHARHKLKWEKEEGCKEERNQSFWSLGEEDISANWPLIDHSGDLIGLQALKFCTSFRMEYGHI